MKKPPKPKFMNVTHYPAEVIQQVMNHTPNPFLAALDKQVFIWYVMGSLSVKHAQKLRVLQEIPTLSQSQVHELVDVFNDEITTFNRLLRTKAEEVHRLTVETLYENIQLFDSLELLVDKNVFIGNSLENAFSEYPKLERAFKKSPMTNMVYLIYKDYLLTKNLSMLELDEEI